MESMSKQPSVYMSVKALVEDMRLRDAIKLLEGRLNASDWKARDRLERAEGIYSLLVDYFALGADDSSRQSQLDSLCGELLDIAMSVSRGDGMSARPSSDYAVAGVSASSTAGINELWRKWRGLASKSQLVESCGGYDADLRRALERAERDIFNGIWVRYPMAKRDVDDIMDIMADADGSAGVKMMIVSAVMLGELEYHDSARLELLYDIYAAGMGADIAARSFAGLILSLSRWGDRIILPRRLRDKLMLSGDTDVTRRRFRETVAALLRTRDTDRINDKMKREVLPELMKLQPAIIKRLKDVTSDFDPSNLDENPEWEEMMRKSGLEDKLRELSEMQTEGADVMMMAFSNLKSFAFFREVQNWFRPFDIRNTAVNDAAGNIPAVFGSVLDSEGIMCDSDKYSFALAYNQMPQAQRDVVANGLNEQLGQLAEELKAGIPRSSQADFGTRVTRALRDLYRFYRLYQRKADFSDPFEMEFSPWSWPVVGEWLDDDLRRLMAEFYFKRNRWSDALPLLRDVDRLCAGLDSQVLEKRGYAAQSLGLLSEALECYLKAQLTNPESRWLQKRIAQVYRLTGDFESAARIYKDLCVKEPDNLALAMHYGNTLFELGEMDTAAAVYYKVDFMKPGKLNARRALAWCELVRGNTEKSINVYESIEVERRVANDFMNLGHAYMVADRRADAARSYLEFASRVTKESVAGGGCLSWRAAMAEDAVTLESLGVPRQSVALMSEYVAGKLG